MRVLIVLAHKSSGRGRVFGERFVKQVREAFASCTGFQERLDVIVRSHSQLAEFLPPPAGETDVPDIPLEPPHMTAPRPNLPSWEGRTLGL